MRVLLWMPDGKVPGGHRVQLEKTAEALVGLGCEVTIAEDQTPDLSEVDVVHGFGLSPEQIRRCRAAGLPVALSTIWWSREYTAGLTMGLWKPRAIVARARFGAALFASALRGQHVSKTWNWLERWQRERVRYELADILLPNSELEAQSIRDDLGVTTPMQVVPNAVDEKRFTLDPAESAAERDARRGVLYAGRIEPHKNQLGLIKAMRGHELPVTVLGPAHPNHATYAERCRRQSGGNVRMLPGVEHEQLPSVYRQYKVHVLPSWFETTGLVSLEAALCGCNIVTTNRGFAREYFGDLAWYCDPAKPKSIREAIEAAHGSPYREALRQRILDLFTWTSTAEASMAAYKLILCNTCEGVLVGS